MYYLTIYFAWIALSPAVSQPGVDHGPRQLAFFCLCWMTPGLLSRCCRVYSTLELIVGEQYMVPTSIHPYIHTYIVVSGRICKIVKLFMTGIITCIRNYCVCNNLYIHTNMIKHHMRRISSGTGIYCVRMYHMDKNRA